MQARAGFLGAGQAGSHFKQIRATDIPNEKIACENTNELVRCRSVRNHERDVLRGVAGRLDKRDLDIAHHPVVAITKRNDIGLAGECIFPSGIAQVTDIHCCAGLSCKFKQTTAHQVGSLRQRFIVEELEQHVYSSLYLMGRPARAHAPILPRS